MRILSDTDTVQGIFAMIIVVMGFNSYPNAKPIIIGLSWLLSKMIANTYDELVWTYELNRWDISIPEFESDILIYVFIGIWIGIFGLITLHLDHPILERAFFSI